MAHYYAFASRLRIAIVHGRTDLPIQLYTWIQHLLDSWLHDLMYCVLYCGLYAMPSQENDLSRDFTAASPVPGLNWISRRGARPELLNQGPSGTAP